MKTIVIVLEAAADEPLRRLDDQTPLALARLHHIGRWARSGCCGVLESLLEPPYWRTGAMLGMLAGVSPRKALTWRRGPLEALTLETAFPAGVGVVYRADFVTWDEDAVRDAAPARVGWSETDALITAWSEGLKSDDRIVVRLTGPGTAAVGWVNDADPVWEGLPPQWVEGLKRDQHLDALRTPDPIERMRRSAMQALVGHPVNEVRVDLGENPANGVWIWGGGRRIEKVRIKPETPSAGVMLTNSLLGEGVAAACGMRTLPLRSPYEDDVARPPFRVPEVVDSLRRNRLLMVYVAAPQPGGRFGSAIDKVRALDHVDQRLLGPLSEVLEAYRPYRLLVAADGAVSSESGRLTAGTSPVLLYGDGVPADAVERWNEEACAAGNLGSMKLRDFWERIGAVEVTTS